jgi:hypothetical protein
VSNDDFRRELNSAFDDVSGPPSSGLRDRVRSAVTEAPEPRGHYWIAGVAACVIAVLIVGVLFVANPFKNGPSLVGPGPSPSPSGQPFVCTQQDLVPGATAPAPATSTAAISSLATASERGYDRLTIEFMSGVPTDVRITPQAGTDFTSSPSGQPATLQGVNGIQVVLRGADLHTAYSGPVDIVTGYTRLAEVRRLEDFEGVVALGLGVNGAACYRAFFLSNPDRLIVDVEPAVQPASPTSTSSATPSASAFACAVDNSALNSAGTPPPVVYLSGLRPAAHGSYDRLVIDLSNGVPANVSIEVRTGTTFTLSPSGMPTTLKGKNSILITIHGADLHTAYSGSTDIVTNYPGLLEVKRIEDFEGVVQIALGVNGPACYHAFYLANPNRLVIDVQAR